ncbi:MAG: hypothetical protein IAF58_05635 [Leptolyngbya sp.]|nr:hypothetical protein [Candidatus Melainabacteria bacterium]
MGWLQLNELDDAVTMAQQTRLPLGSVLVMSGHLSDKELRACVLGQSLLKDNVIIKEDMFKVMGIVRERTVSFEEGMQMLEGMDVTVKETNKLGELLLEAERITPHQLQVALETVESSGLPLGRVLVLTGAVTEPILKVGLEVQVGVRDGILTRHDAIAKLRNTSSVTSVTRTSMQMTVPMLDKILRIGEFFEKAGIISDTDMLNALEVALTQQRRVGEVLVQFNLVTEKLVDAALELQHLTRGRQIRPDQAVAALQNIHYNGMSIHQALGLPEPESTSIRPEALYSPEPASQAPVAVPAVSAQAQVPEVHGEVLSGWGDETPEAETRDGWGDGSNASAARPASGWGEGAQQAPVQDAEQASMAAPAQHFVTASGEFGSTAATAAAAATPAQSQAYEVPPQPSYQSLPAQQGVAPQAPVGYVPPPTMPGVPSGPQAAYRPLQSLMPQVVSKLPPFNPVASDPPSAPMTSSPVSYTAPPAVNYAQANVEISLPSNPVEVAQTVPLQEMPAPVLDSVAEQLESLGFEDSDFTESEAAQIPEPPPAPLPQASAPDPDPAPFVPPQGLSTETADTPVIDLESIIAASNPPSVQMTVGQPVLPEPTSLPPKRQDAVDGVIAEIAFEAAQFAAAQEASVASAGGLGFAAVGLAQLLKVTGIVTQDEMDRAIKDVIRDSVLLHDILKSSGVGDPQTLRAAYDAHIMVIGGQLTFEHAMIALDFCKRQKISLYEAFQQLGWLQE